MSLPVNVLMVEDSEDDAELLLLELRRRGFAPTASRVDTGPTLRAALARGAWDVVISDHNMPGFSGEEALKVVKQYAPELPFIVVSGTRGEEHAVDAMRAGASDFIVKTRLHRLAPVVERELHESALRLEQRRMTAALAESQQQLRQAQKLEAVGRLAGGVAHDFNNLLGAILGYTELLLDSYPVGDTRRMDLEEIKRASIRAAELTRQLLAFSRQQVLDPAVLDLNEVIVGVLQLLRRIVGDSVAIDTHYGRDLWNIKGDRIRIEQIVMNLAANARDAMPRGGTLTIATSNVLVPSPDLASLPPIPGHYVRLEVRDTGEGIAPDVLPKIFEPFFTTKEEGKGTGLGLATVHGIVEQSGGFIFVEGESGPGAAFAIFLPRTVERRTAQFPGLSAGVEAAVERRILVVEGQAADRERSAQTLRHAGYEVRVAAPEEALAALRHDDAPIDLLVTDVAMPGMTGPVLAERLHAVRPDVPVLFITGATDPKIDPLQIFDHGDILVRPFAAADLLTKVREAFSLASS
jgi:two-component system cell cycle sensor histidine kinase/response regulator CckA